VILVGVLRFVADGVRVRDAVLARVEPVARVELRPDAAFAAGRAPSDLPSDLPSDWAGTSGSGEASSGAAAVVTDDRSVPGAERGAGVPRRLVLRVVRRPF